MGQLVTVFVQTGEATQGMAAPRSAVIAGENGQSIVFEHVRAERFERREVRAVPLDSGRMLISAVCRRAGASSCRAPNFSIR